ncbi:MAG: hypothetical protein BRC29_01600 [Nanohaloarchaea archaeon SW_7_43_1]|nr:MAG: hypothetical protein BRC29_01600 [Nanohaloarchaea archaeon SW_7_43_1]
MEEDFSDNPVIEAGKKYNKLYNQTQKLAEAAHQHPGIAYELGSTPHIGSELHPSIEVSENGALADMKVFSYFVSRAWEEAQEYFLFDLEEEYQEYLDNEIEDTDIQEEVFKDLTTNYDKLEKDLAKLNRALGHLLDQTPGKEVDGSYILEPKQKLLQAAD